MSALALDPSGFRATVAGWLTHNAGRLTPFRSGHDVDLASHVERLRPFHALLYDAELARAGWPVEAGGVGGTALLRGILYDEVLRAGYGLPKGFEFLEIIAPMLQEFAPHIAVARMPGLLRGDALLCQGFSEPESGSDLGSVRTRAELVDGEFVVSGQKTWIGNGHVADWCLLLARTGTLESRHRGLTMMWVDMRSDGISTRPIDFEDGRSELAELFLDEVRVPVGNVVGDVNGGWRVAMKLLQFERGNWAWQRQAALLARLSAALDAAEMDDDGVMNTVGSAWLDVTALRAASGAILRATARGESAGPESSATKLLLSQAEKSVVDATRALAGPRSIMNDALGVGAGDWFFSRSTSVFGGAAEIQRDVIADRVLGLGRVDA